MLSTFEVYGNTGKDVYQESDAGVIDQNMIRSCYPESKRCMEILARCYEEEYGVNTVIGRLCSIYGPTMVKDDSKAHAQFIRNVLRDEDIVMKSKGEQYRSWIYVVDCVAALLTILQYGVSGQAYNVADEQSCITIRQLAEMLAHAKDKKVVFDIDEISGNTTPISRATFSTKKLAQLGWQPLTTISEGLLHTLIAQELFC